MGNRIRIYRKYVLLENGDVLKSFLFFYVFYLFTFLLRFGLYYVGGGWNIHKTNRWNKKKGWISMEDDGRHVFQFAFLFLVTPATTHVWVDNIS